MPPRKPMRVCPNWQGPKPSNRSAKIHDNGIDEDFRHEQIDEDDLIGELAEFADFLGENLPMQIRPSSIESLL